MMTKIMTVMKTGPIAIWPGHPRTLIILIEKSKPKKKKMRRPLF